MDPDTSTVFLRAGWWRGRDHGDYQETERAFLKVRDAPAGADIVNRNQTKSAYWDAKDSAAQVWEPPIRGRLASDLLGWPFEHPRPADLRFEGPISASVEPWIGLSDVLQEVVRAVGALTSGPSLDLGVYFSRPCYQAAFFEGAGSQFAICYASLKTGGQFREAIGESLGVDGSSHWSEWYDVCPFPHG